MAGRSITDDLLRTAVGLRVDAGVSTSKIERLIDRFASDRPLPSTTDGASQWVGARAVPQDRREELLKELAALPPDPDHSPADARLMSAIDIWPNRIAEEARMHRTGPLDQIAGEPAGAPEPVLNVEAIEPADLDWTVDWAVALVGEAVPEAVDGERHRPEPADYAAANEAALPALPPEPDSTEGGIVMLDDVDVNRVKHEIEMRRDEMLSRHAKELKDMLVSQAEEMKVLDADQRELEVLEQSLATFARKFQPSSPDVSVTKLTDERALRFQNLA